MSIDSIGNFLTIIRNGIRVAKPFVLVPFSKINYGIAKILKEEGFLNDVLLLEEDHKKLKIFLRYKNGESVIHEIKRVSVPGRRHYSGIKKIKPVIGGLGVSIVSTNLGVITNKEAKKKGVGGEVLCSVW